MNIQHLIKNTPQINLTKNSTTQIKQVLTSEEVAPFAKRLLNTDSFNMTSGTTKVIKAINKTREELDNIRDKKAKVIFTNLYEKIINETSNIENISDRYRTIIQKFELLNNEEYSKYLLIRLENLTDLKKTAFRTIFTTEMKFLEDFTDAVNILEDKYSSINSKPRELYKWLNNGNSWFTDLVEGKSVTEQNFRNGYASNSKKKMDFSEYQKLISNYKDIDVHKIYQNDIRLEAFKKFVEDYQILFPKSVDLIYEHSYLPKISPELKESFLQIKKTYKTLIINSNTHTTQEDAKYIEEELKLWLTAGKDRTILPKVIEVDLLDNDLNHDNASGQANTLLRSIKIKEVLPQEDTDKTFNNQTLRHEITHLNDRNLKPESDFERLVKYVKWIIFKKCYAQECRKELTNGRINNYNIYYSLKNQYELASVTSEAEIDKLSKTYLNRITKWFNLENWLYTVEKNKYVKNNNLN